MIAKIKSSQNGEITFKRLLVYVNHASVTDFQRLIFDHRVIETGHYLGCLITLIKTKMVPWYTLRQCLKRFVE